MRIVHVVPALSKGGGERIAVELANHSARVGHQVTLIAAYPVDAALLRDSLHPDVWVRYVSESVNSRVGRYIFMVPWLLRHRSWLVEQDILHCHLTYGSVFGSAVGVLRRLLGAKRPHIVETYHAVGMPIPRLHRWFHARLAADRDALSLVAEDDYWRAFLADHPCLLSAIIPNGISISCQGEADPTARRAYRRELGIPEDCRFVIGTVGRLEPDRQPWLYLPIFTEVARALGPEVHFVLAGGGSELDRMRSLVVEHGLEGRVHFPGLVIDPCLPLSIMDIYVTLNVGPTTGVAALEAALLNLPVLGIQMLAGYRPSRNDWIWSSDNLLEVAAQSIQLLQEPSKKLALTERQGTYVRANHTSEVMASAFSKLYQAINDRNENRESANRDSSNKRN